MKKKLLILLIALAVLAVPAAAEEKNWSYALSTDASASPLSFGCNQFATDGYDPSYDMETIPPTPGVTVKDGYFSITGYMLMTVMNAPLTPSHNSTSFTYEVYSNETHTTSWNSQVLPDTIVSIVMVNQSDASDTHNLKTAGSFTHGPSTQIGSVFIPELYTITVTYDLEAPTAAFSGTPTSISVGDTVTFTDESTGIIDSWSWDFGDGVGTSTDQNPTYTYNTQGTYNVTLIATNEAGSDDEVKADYITVTGPPPVANFTYTPASPKAGDEVNFTDTSSNTPTAWFWDFGDGATATVADPTHIYTVAGTYTVNLTATNNGGSDSYEDTVTVAVQDAPVAAFSGAPLTGEAPLTVNFTDESTGYNITYWVYDFDAGDSGSSHHTYGYGNPSYTYTEAGYYGVSLTVINDGGQNTTSTPFDYITVTGPAPTASFTTNVTSGEAPLTVSFTDTSVAYAGSNITGWEWAFGDGTIMANVQNPTWTYSSPGSYNVTLTVTDDSIVPASNTSAPTNIMVSGPAPVADFSGAPVIVSVMNGLVNFTDLSTSAGFTVSTWDWAFGDGGTSTVKNATHTYITKGIYTVTLTVEDNQVPAKNDTETKTNYIEVVGEPTANFTWPTAPDVVVGYPSATVNYTNTSVADGNATINGWAWDFGAAGSQIGQTPAAVNFTTPGWYDVSLNVTDTAGGYNEVTKERIVHVLNDSPVASFTATPLTGDAPLAVTFNDTSTGGPVETYAWTFGDGGTSAVANPVYTYTTPGIWNASLNVTNDGGTDSYGPVSINVTQPPVPIPDFTASTTSGRSPLTVQFFENISGSWDSVLWEFEDADRIFTSTDANPEFQFYRVGQHNVSLTAYNAVGNMTETKVDYINVLMPISSGDNDNGGSSAVTPTPTAQPTTAPGDVTPTPTYEPTAEPTGEVTPSETATPVTPVPTATAEPTGTAPSGDTGGIPWVPVVLVVVIVAVVGGYFFMNKKE